jgi:hypothetical protein
MSTEGNDVITAQVILELAGKLLPKPVRTEHKGRKTTIVGGDPGKAVIQVLPDRVKISVYGVSWVGTHMLKADHEMLAEMSYESLSDPRTAEKILRKLVQVAVLIRKSQFRKCTICLKVHPPEHMLESTCHSCAEKHLGIVF